MSRYAPRDIPVGHICCLLIVKVDVAQVILVEILDLVKIADLARLLENLNDLVDSEFIRSKDAETLLVGLLSDLAAGADRCLFLAGIGRGLIIGYLGLAVLGSILDDLIHNVLDDGVVGAHSADLLRSRIQLETDVGDVEGFDGGAVTVEVAILLLPAMMVL